MTIAALALLRRLAQRGGADAGDAIITRARAAESAQLRTLSRAPVALRTSGRFGDGKATHTFESLRRFAYGSDGTVSNTFERGQVDGKPVTEEELRKAMGVKDEPKERGDVIAWALAPLSSPAIEVTALGPAADGGYTLRCRVTRDAVVSTVTLLVDEKTAQAHRRTSRWPAPGPSSPTSWRTC